MDVTWTHDGGTNAWELAPNGDQSGVIPGQPNIGDPALFNDINQANRTNECNRAGHLLEPRTALGWC